MKSGRELDALVAERVMGWTWWDARVVSEYGLVTQPKTTTGYNTKVLMPPKARESSTAFLYENFANGYYPAYSTDIVAAWQIVNRFKEQSMILNYGEDTQKWECSFIVNGNRYWGVSSIVPIAICIAALRIVGIDIDEKQEE